MNIIGCLIICVELSRCWCEGSVKSRVIGIPPAFCAALDLYSTVAVQKDLSEWIDCRFQALVSRSDQDHISTAADGVT